MQLTVEIPDRQAQDLGLNPEALESVMTRLLKKLPSLIFVQEILEFLGQNPSAEQIANFYASERSQQRIRALLEKNREGALTSEEREELNSAECLNQIVGIIKARALQQLPRRS